MTMQALRMAAFNVVHKFGTDKVAALLGKRIDSISHEVSLNPTGTAKFGLADAAAVTLASGDLAIPRAFAELCNCVLVALPTLDDSTAGDSAMAHVTKLAKEFADSMAALSEALGDGRITREELRRFDEQSMELIEAVSATRRFMHARAESDAGAARAAP